MIIQNLRTKASKTYEIEIEINMKESIQNNILFTHNIGISQVSNGGDKGIKCKCQETYFKISGRVSLGDWYASQNYAASNFTMVGCRS